MVLEVETNTREVDLRLNSGCLELLGVTYKLLDHMSPHFHCYSIYIPIPDRWRIRGEERVPPDTTICLRALKMRGFS